MEKIENQKKQLNMLKEQFRSEKEKYQTQMDDHIKILTKEKNELEARQIKSKFK
mgnify:CR=1 FL=1